MTPKALKKIKQQLKGLQKSPQNHNYKDFVALALQLGRVKDNRGKEPTYVRVSDPRLSPPLSIPKHSGDMKPRTAKSIIDALLSDVDEWELYFAENTK